MTLTACTDNTSTSTAFAKYDMGCGNSTDYTSTATTTNYDVAYPNYYKYIEYVAPGDNLEFDSWDMAKLKPKKPRILPKLFMDVEEELMFSDVVAQFK